MKKLIAIICMIAGMMASLIFMPPASAANWRYVGSYQNPYFFGNFDKIKSFINLDTLRTTVLGKNRIETINMVLVDENSPNAPPGDYLYIMWSMYINCGQHYISGSRLDSQGNFVGTSGMIVPGDGPLAHKLLSLCKH